MDIRWEAPPSVRRTGRVSDSELELAAALRDRPDQWARMIDFEGDMQPKAGQLAQMIRSGRRAAFRTDGPIEDGEFEAVSRKDPEKRGVTAVYVRYATLRND